MITTSAGRSALIRRSALGLLCLLLAASVYGFLHLGTFMAREDPLARADAIFILAGTVTERPMEAADLFAAGYAPRVLLTRSMSDSGAFDAARKRGVQLAGEFDQAKSVLMQLGVPDSAIVTPSRAHDNTAQEAETLRAIALQERWSRVIVVSSKYHLRRVSLACGRALAGTQVQIILRGSRYDQSVPARWWKHRADMRWLASEVPKLALYASGLGA